MVLTTEGLNVWAIAVSAVTYFAIGALWYTVLFAKAWVRAYGLSKEDVKAMGERQNPAVVFPSMLACNIATALVFAMLVASLGIAGAGGGVTLGILLWLGFAGACAFTTHLGSLRPVAGFAIDTGYHLVSLMVVGAILGSWQ